MRMLGALVVSITFLLFLLQPSVAHAVITLCNSSAAEMGLTTVLEDPNRSLFTKYPYTSRGFFTLRPAECSEVSMGSSEGMRVHFQTYYRADDGSWQPGQYDIRNAREIQRSGRKFCGHERKGWDLMGEPAVNCQAGYIQLYFGYKLVVPMNARDYRLSLTANRPAAPAPPRSSPTVVGEPLDGAEELDRLLKDGLAGRACNRTPNVSMQYLPDVVSVTPQGVIKVRVDNWYNGKLTASEAAEVQVRDLASIKRGTNYECTTLDLKCKEAASLKGRSGHCVTSSSLGTSKSLRLYFPSEAKAEKFRELVPAKTSGD